MYEIAQQKCIVKSYINIYFILDVLVLIKC